MMPRYSIVVPTSDRARLLTGSLQALSELDYDDYEILVSNNGSSDDTETVAKEFCQNDPRFRYVRTSSKLPMADHWDFAVKHVDGDYFIYVGDDDSLDKNTLRALDQYFEKYAVDGVSWRRAEYYYGDWPETKHAKKFYIPPFSGEKTVTDSGRAIDGMFRLEFPHNFPRGNSFCFKTETVKAILHRYGHFFLRPCPDFSSTMIYFGLTKNYLQVELALSVLGMSSDSNAASHRKGGSRQRYFDFLKEHAYQIYPNAPLKYELIFNAIVESLRTVQLTCPGLYDEYSIDWAFYFVGIYARLRDRNERILDDYPEGEFWRALWTMPLGVKAEVVSKVARIEGSRMVALAKRSLARIGSHCVRETFDPHDRYFCRELGSMSECSRALATFNQGKGY